MKIFDLLKARKSDSLIGVVMGDIYISYMEDNIMKLIRTNGKEQFVEDDILREYVDIKRDEGLYQTILTFISNGFVVYLQELDTIDEKGFKIIYICDLDGNLIVGLDNDYFLHEDYYQFVVGERVTPAKDFNNFENILYQWIDDRYVRKSLNFKTCYKICCGLDDVKDIIPRFINEEDEKYITSMNRGLVYINENIIKLHNSITSRDELISKYIEFGYDPLIRYIGMDLSYIFHQMRTLYNDVDILIHMLSTTPYREDLKGL